MKRARQKAPTLRTAPRNPLVRSPLLGKGGAHQRHDEKAPRARQQARLRRRLVDDLA